MSDIVERLRDRINDSHMEAERMMDDAAVEIQSLRQRVERLEKYARDISKAITGLTIGAGSEWFKPVGDEYYVDPAFAAQRLGEMLDKGRDARKQLARAALGGCNG